MQFFIFILIDAFSEIKIIQSIDVGIPCEGSPSLLGPQRHHKVAGAYPWALGKEASCGYIVQYAGNCQVSGTYSWKNGQKF